MSEEKNVSRNSISFFVRVYFVEIVKGLLITIRHLIRNILVHEKGLQTISYPEEQKVVPEGYRGTHRLTLRDDGTPRCTACYLCSTVCPANCIHIEAIDKGDNVIEKRPAKFEIDELRCVFCGFCVEVCPCDAIRMDSGETVMAEYTRRDLILDINELTAKTSHDGVPLQTHAQGVNPKQRPGAGQAETPEDA